MIRSLSIKNLLAIEALDLTFDPNGALITGANGRGKSTLLKAFKLALDGAGVSPEAVRKGTTAAEIVIDLDHDTVRRRIGANGSTSLTVDTDGDARRKKPQAFLSELLGLALLDPLDFFLAKAPERRAMVLRAVPCTVTRAQLAPYMPDDLDVPEQVFALHGLDVVDLVRQRVADRRVNIGRDVKTKEQEAGAARLRETGLQGEAAKLASAPTKRAAGERLYAATVARGEIGARATSAAKHGDYVEREQNRAIGFGARAKKIREDAPLAPTGEELEVSLEAQAATKELHKMAVDAWGEATREIDRIKAMLQEAVETERQLKNATAAAWENFVEAEAARATLEGRELDAHTAHEKAAELDEQAREVLAALAALAIEAPTDDEKAAADIEHAEAERAVRDADEAERARKNLEDATRDAEAKSKAHEALVARYDALDAAVKALANDVPRELLAGAAGLSGLTIEGDTILVEDTHGARVSVEQLNTAAQMSFALTVAKRLNAKSKLLFVDGLERLDPENMRAFVALALEDGYQLFATRVTEGPLAVTSIGGAS